jgi:hypothetical protein
MKYQTALPILALAATTLLCAPVQAQTLDTFGTVPAAPAPGDHVVLQLGGIWPDGCVPEASRTLVTRTGSKVDVRFNYSGFSGACTAALTPWSLDVPVGPLDAGEYTVEVSRLLTLVPPQKIGTRTFAVTPLAESTVWLPGFSAPGATTSLASTLTAFNNSDAPATVTFVGAWDALGAYAPPAPAVIGPAAAAILDSRSLREGQPVQMLALRAPRRVAVRATLERLETVPEGLPKVPESLGRVELPVFTEMVPAGMTAVAGDVSLSALECASGPEARRRVNLTLFNAGDATASFRVTATGTEAGPGGSPTELSYSVPAKSLVQFNAISLDSLPVCQAGGAWFRITGDQPFLAYVSTVRPETLPGVLPYEIFPAKLDR